MIVRDFFAPRRRENPRNETHSTMSNLTRKEVEAIAHLARLAITEAEMPVYVKSLSSILAFVEQLSAAGTEGVEAMAHPLEGQTQRLRPDVVTEADARAKYQKNAPQVEAGLYLVPKVIE